MRVIKSIKLHSNKVMAGHCALSVSSVMMLWDAAFPVPPESMARWCDAENMACWCSGYIFPRWPWQRLQCRLYQNHFESVELGRALMRAWNKQLSSSSVRKKDKLRTCVSLISNAVACACFWRHAVFSINADNKHARTYAYAWSHANVHSDWVSVSRWQSPPAPAALSDHDYALSHQLPHADSLLHKSAPGQPHMPFINDISMYRQDLKIIQVNCFQATK